MDYDCECKGQRRGFPGHNCLRAKIQKKSLFHYDVWAEKLDDPFTAWYVHGYVRKFRTKYFANREYKAIQKELKLALSKVSLRIKWANSTES